MQIMEMIEDKIISCEYTTDELIISTTAIAKLLSVNPTTAVKAVSILTAQEILYKRRGVGMCVAEGARTKIISKRKAAFFGGDFASLLDEASKLGISKEELINVIKEHKHD